MLDPKQIKRLAKACRDSGIVEFNSPEFSFKLSPDAPVKFTAKPKTQTLVADTAEVQTDGWDSLSEMQKLFYSVGDTNESEAS